MVLQLRKVQQARDAGASDEQILDSIARNEEDFAEPIGRGREADIGDKQILDRILVKQQRGQISDAATQALVSPVTGVIGAPAAAVEFAKSTGEFLLDPKGSIEGFTRGLASKIGLPVDPERPKGVKPAKTLAKRLGQVFGGETVERQTPAEFILGKETAETQKKFIEKYSGLAALETYLGRVAAGAKKELSRGGLATIMDLPTSQEVRDRLSKSLGVDLDPQTVTGRLTSGFIEEAANNMFLGPEAALAIGRATTVGDTLREAGAPEFIATPAEIGSLFLKGRRPPARQRLVEGPKISAKQLEDLRGGAIEEEALATKRIAEAEFQKAELAEIARQRETLELSAQEEGQLKIKSDRAAQKLEAAETEIIEAGEAAGAEIPQSFTEPVEAAEIIDTIEQEAVKPLLNSIAPVEDVEVGLTRTKKIIDERFTRDRAVASNFYDEASSRLEGRQGTFTTVEGSGVTFHTEDALIDFIATVEKSGLAGVGKAAVIATAEDLLAAIRRGLPLDEAIIRKQNMNTLFDFEFPDPGARKKAASVFSKVRKTFIQDLNRSIKSANKEAFIDWRKAERKHASNARLYGDDTVQKLQRGEGVLESRAALTKPEKVGSLKRAVGNEPSFNQLIDRLVIEEMNEKGLAKTSKTDIGLMKKRLEPRNIAVLNELENLSNPLKLNVKNIDLQRAVLDDVVNAHLTGMRPEIALKLMQTPEGVDIARRALNRTANGKKALQNVENLFVNDIFRSLIKDGKVDLAAATKLSKNKQLISALRKVSPTAAKIIERLPEFIKKNERALKRLADLEDIGNKISEQTKRLDKKVKEQKALRNQRAGEITKAEKVIKNREIQRERDALKSLKEEINRSKQEASQAKQMFGMPNSFIAGLVVLNTLGIPLGKFLLLTKGATISARGLARVLKNPETRRLLTIIETKPLQRVAALRKLSQIADPEVERKNQAKKRKR